MCLPVDIPGSAEEDEEEIEKGVAGNEGYLADIAEVEPISNLNISCIACRIWDPPTLIRRMLYFRQSAFRKGNVNLVHQYSISQFERLHSPNRYLTLLGTVMPHVGGTFGM